MPITKYCDQNRLSPHARLKLFIPVCQAIQHAHQKGIIHRDVKPSNVLVTLYDGQPVPKVIDFGIAKATGQTLTERTMFTEVGQIVGTLEYMSPEQAELNQLDIDTRSDVYALGVLLYELLTGTTPITKQQLQQAGITEMLRTIREQEPPKPSTRLSDSGEALPSISAVRSTEPAKLSRIIRGDLDWVVMKALEKDRGRRYGTASALAEDVERYLAHEPVQAGPPGSVYRIRKFVGKHRRSIATIAALLLMLVSGVVISTWQALRASYEERRANQAAAQAIEEAQNARKQEQIANLARARSEQLAQQEQQSRVQAQRNLYFARISTVQNALEAGDVDAARQVLNQCAPSLRGWEWHYLFAQTRPLGIVARDSAFPASAAYAPDGKSLLAWMRATGAASLWNATTGELRYTLWPQQKVDDVPYSCSPAWSPDGKRFAWWRGGSTIEIIQGSSGEIVESWQAKQAVAVLIWHPRGTQLATLEHDEMLRIWDTKSKSMVHETALPSSKVPWPFQFIAWSHDGSLFAVGARAVVHVFDASNWQLVARLEAGNTVPCFGWAPRSNRILFSAQPQADEKYPMISIWQRDSQPVPVTAWYRDAFCIAWSPDGTQVAWIHRGDGSVHVHDSATGKLMRSFPSDRAAAGRWVAWHADGKRLASATGDRSVKVWDLDSGTTQPVAVLQGHERQVRWVQWSPQADSSLASFSTDKSIRLWNLDDPAIEPSQVIRTEAPIASLSWGPDGKRLAGATAQTAGQLSTVFVWDAKTGDVLATPFLDSGGQPTIWHRENRLLCTQPDQWTVRIMDPDSDFTMKLELEGDRPSLSQEGVLKGSGVRWSRDGRWLAIATERNGAVVWDYARRTAIRVPSGRAPGDQWARSLAWHPEGSMLAVIYRGTTHEVVVHRFDAQARTFQTLWRRRRPQIGFGYPGELEFSPDGSVVAMGDADSSIRIWNAENGEMVSAHRGHTGSASGIDWSPDGTRFASAGGDGTIRIWSPLAKQSLLVLRGHSGPVSDVEWHEDGFRLASAGMDRTIRVWDTRSGYVAARSTLALQLLEGERPPMVRDETALRIRAEILIRSGQWQQASAELDALLKLDEAQERQRLWYATGWWVSGPYNENHLDAAPELLEGTSLVNSLQPPDDQSADKAARRAWRYVSGQLHYLDLRQEFDGDGIAAYALARIYSSKDQEVALTVRADDAVGVWMNGRHAHSDPDDRVRTILDAATEIPATLRTGWNNLLLKVVNAPGTDRFELALDVTGSSQP